MSELHMKQLWQVSPDPSRANILTARVYEDVTIITLSVRKPNTFIWEDFVKVQLSLDEVQNGTQNIGPKWIQQFESDIDGKYEAFRIWKIQGTPFVLCWVVKHTDKYRDGTKYEINDSLNVLDLRTLKQT